MNTEAPCAVSLDRYSKTALLTCAKRMLAGVLRHRVEGEYRIALPWQSSMRHPYSSERWGGERELELETLARSMFLAACITANDPACSVAGISLREFYLQWLLRLTRDARFLPLKGRHDQATVEAALICVSLEEGGFLEAASPTERKDVLDWLSAYRSALAMHNNWQWFAMTIKAFLRKHGEGTEQELVPHLLLIEKMYAGDGWYRDGLPGCFDFYAGWGFQFYPLFLLRWGALDRRTASVVETRNDRFLNSYSHVFSRGGHMPCWGRSVTYRFAASAPFGAAFMREAVGFDPGFARHICAGNLRQFMKANWLRDGVPSLGFYDEEPRLIDPYSCIASPMWCFKHFVCLLLDDANPFWQARESTGWWGSCSRYDIAGTGMYVEHDDVDSTLHAPQRRGGDPRYEQPSFSTDEGTAP